MTTKTDIDADTRRAIRTFAAKAARQYDVAHIILFGSRARQNHRLDSDADVAVLLRGAPQPFLETKLALADIAYDVLLEAGVLIQPLPVWEDEWEHPERHVNPHLLHNIDREGVRL